MKITSSSEVNRIKAKVPGWLWQDVLDYVYSDLLMGLTANMVEMHVDGYDMDWCEADGSERISQEADDLLYKYAQSLTGVLLAHYSED